MADINKDFQEAMDQHPHLKMYLDSLNRRRAMVIQASSRTSEERELAKVKMTSMLSEMGSLENPTATSVVEYHMKHIRDKINKWTAWCDKSRGKIPYVFSIDFHYGRPLYGIVAANDEDMARTLVMERVYHERNRLAALKGYHIDVADIDVSITEAAFDESLLWVGQIQW